MSATRPSRHHGFRGYGAADHDRLKRSLLQPVQSWERKWQYPSNGVKGFKIMKWVKCVTTPARQPIIETEPDSTNFLRPLPHLLSIPKAPSLLREASQASFTSVSTPGETITTNNNNTPHDMESSVGNSPEMEDEEEPMEDIITSQQIFKKNDQAKDNNIEFKENTKQVSDNINISKIYNKQTSIVSGIFDKNQDEYGSQANNEYSNQPNNEFNNQANNDYGNQPNNNFGNRASNDYGDQTNNDYDSQANDDFGRTTEYGISEYGNTSEYGSNEYLGRTNEFGSQNADDYEESLSALSDYDKQPNEYTDLHIKYGEQQSNIPSQISEYTQPQNPYQEHEVIDFIKHEKAKDVQENDIEQGQFNLEVFTKNIQDS
ncbi:22767_t:CDS:2 [Rhizophagus irregularis]|nr:22767_t:CDS:2 [Rhizophagus irregularis]